MKHKKTLLLSYPRCGNTLMRYFLEFVTGQPTEGYKTVEGTDHHTVASKQSHITIDSSLPKIIKRHAILADEDLFTVDRLILLLRDPLECITRHHGKEVIVNWSQDKQNREFGIGHPIYYIRNIGNI